MIDLGAPYFLDVLEEKGPRRIHYIQDGLIREINERLRGSLTKIAKRCV